MFYRMWSCFIGCGFVMQWFVFFFSFGDLGDEYFAYCVEQIYFSMH